MSNQPARRMTRHIELRHHSNAALACVSDDIAYLILSIEEPIGSHLMKFRVALRFNSKPLVFREVPVKHVELHRSHAIQIALHDVDRLEVTPHIYQQTTPAKAWLVLNAHGTNEVPLAIAFQKLQECFEPAHRSNYGGGLQRRLVVRYLERITFILFKGRHRFPWPLA